MPRNSSGNYTLPAGNPVVPNTLIETTWANPTMSDIGSAITDSLDRQGRGSMLAPLKLTDGTNVAPSLSFSSESASGVYRVAAGFIGFSIAGTLAMSLGATGLSIVSGLGVGGNASVGGTLAVTGALTIASLVAGSGTGALPSYSFVGDLNTGMYSPGADTIGLSTAGIAKVQVTSAGHVLIGPTVPTDAAQLTVDRFGTSTAPALTTGTVAAFLGNTSAAAPAYLSLVAGNAGLSGVNFGDTDADSRGFVRYDHATDTMGFAVGTITRFTISGTSTLAGNLAPEASGTRDIGTTALEFNNFYIRTIQRDSAGTLAIQADNAAGVITLATAGSVRQTIAAAGGITMPAPDSGDTLTVQQIAGARSIISSQALGGGQMSWRLENSSNTASSSARLAVVTGGASADDPFAVFSVTGVANYAIGIDNSASGALKISRAAVLGSSDALTLSSTGNFTISAPASGDALTVTAVSGSAAAVLNDGGGQVIAHLNSTNVNGGFLRLQRSGVNKAFIGMGGLSFGATDDLLLRGEAAFSVATGGPNARLTIGSAGNVTINQPASGANTLIINSTSGAAGVAVNINSAGATTDYALITHTGLVTTGFSGVGNAAVANGTLQNAYAMGTQSNHDSVWMTGNARRVTLAAGGNVTIAAPTSGVSLSVAQVSGGTGIQLSSSLSGASVLQTIVNSSNTASSDSLLYQQVAGASAGDAYHRFEVSGVANWTAGVDNSDGDNFKINSAATLGSGQGLGISIDGRLWGTALHNNAGAVTGTTNQYIASGTYTPTMTNISNANPTTQVAQWMRVGNVVTVAGVCSLAPGAANSIVSFRVSLPIASALSSFIQLGGACSANPNTTAANTWQCGSIVGDDTNDAAQFDLYCGAVTTSRTCTYTFSYVVL